jgi:hypothetical protein
MTMYEKLKFFKNEDKASEDGLIRKLLKKLIMHLLLNEVSGKLSSFRNQ